MVKRAGVQERLGTQIPDCEFCGHDWHGTECRILEGPNGRNPHPMWPSVPSHPCECPSSFVEPPC